MITSLRARVSVRAAARLTACCSAAVVGLAAAYLCGDAIQKTMTRVRAHSLADAAAQGFSEAALQSRGGGMAPGAYAIARRHDPYPGAVSRHQRQAELFAARLEQRDQQSIRSEDLRPASHVFTAPAQPFRVSGALSSAREMECLTQAVYYEARGETPAGQAAVAQVVLNRVRHPAYPKSVCGVVFQGAQRGRTCQFSFACDGSLHRTRESGAWRRAQGVAARALDGFVLAEVGNATHFHAARIGPQWSGMVRVSQVGLHVFYRFGGRNGGAGAFRQRYRPEAISEAVYASLIPVVDASSLLNLAQSEKASPAEVAVAKAAEAPADPKSAETPAESVSSAAPGTVSAS